MTSTATHVFLASLILLAPTAATAGHATGRIVPPMRPTVVHVQPLVTENVLHIFSGPPDGAGPFGGLLPGKHGEFFGTTLGGGVTTPSGCCGGIVYEISSTGQETILYNFQGGNDGLSSEASLISDASGNLYGVTSYGGGALACSMGCGTVFELQPMGSTYTERVLYAFQGGLDGQLPIAALTMGANGVISGTTFQGGTGACTGSGFTGCGTVFRLTPNGSTYTESVVYNFQGGNDGANPAAKMIADARGNLYGTTAYGGTQNSICPVDSMGNNTCGTVFKISGNGKEHVIHRFAAGASDGAYPRSALLAVGDSFVGVTHFGGSTGGSNPGTVYELTPSGKKYTERLLYVFGANGSSDAFRPSDADGLFADKDGNLYGTADVGGQQTCGCGAVFELSPVRSRYHEKVLYSFGGVPDGDDPRASVVLMGRSLYGITFGGGTTCYGSSFECGTVYKLRI